MLLTRERDRAVLTSPRTCPSALDRIRAIAHELEHEPGLTARQLAERTGLERRQVVLLLLRLEEHGHVVHEARRWFPGSDLVR
jgi:DNA-binding IclR family transcriptional regulator